MKVLATTMCRNEEKIIPYYIHHYSNIADKIILMDHSSTDKTVELATETAKKLGVDLSVFVCPNEGWDDVLSLQFKQTFYKQFADQYDVVILGDTDEFWHHPEGTRKVLESFWIHRKDELFIKPVGFQMISESFPDYSGVPMIDIVREGARDPGFDKPLCLSTKLQLIGSLGMHYGTCINQEGVEIAPIGYSGMMLLHYKFLGKNYAVSRVISARDNLSARGKSMASNGVGCHLLDKEENLRKGLEDWFAKKEKLDI